MKQEAYSLNEETAVNGNYRELLKTAYLQIRQLRDQVQTLQTPHQEPVAIIGMACRFPGQANNPAAYWRLLHDGIDAITSIPPDRWDVEAYYDADPDAPGKMYTKYGGFLDEVDMFDPHLFGISPREAASLDPQHRLLLEVCWEAIENAGYAPPALKGTQTGCFVGLDTDDYSKLSLNSGDATQVSAHSKLGTADRKSVV